MNMCPMPPAPGQPIPPNWPVGCPTMPGPGPGMDGGMNMCPVPGSPVPNWPPNCPGGPGTPDAAVDLGPPREQPVLPVPATAPAIRAASLQPPPVGGCSLPDLNKLTLSAVQLGSLVTVTGAAGAVAPGAKVFLQSLPLGAQVSATAAGDGSFSKAIEGTDASTIVVNCGMGNPQSWQQGGAALFLHQPRAAVAKNAVPIALGGPGADPVSEFWTASGTMSGWSFRAGERVTMDLTMSYYSARITAGSNSNLVSGPAVTFVRFSDGTGAPVQANFVPVLLTPTGLPIFDRAEISNDGWRMTAEKVSASAAAGSMTARYTMSFQIPSTMPAGSYVPEFAWNLNGVLGNMMMPPAMGSTQKFQQGVTSRNWGPVMKVGDPENARLPWVLMGSTLSNGNRGVVAREDRSRFHFGNKTNLNGDRMVLPLLTRQGGPQRLRIEPSLPTISHQIGGPDRPVPPLVSFVFPQGKLRVQITRPDGVSENLGEAPFRAGRALAPDEVAFGNTSINDVYELTTFDPGFDYTFSQYGHYVVTMDGWSVDAIGNVYPGGGTYDVYIAESLDADLGTFGGTPFEVGNAMSPVVNVNPPVPATVTLTVRHYPASDPAAVVTRTITGQANRYGYFRPSNAATLDFAAHGEYVVDLLAEYTDTQNRLWMGSWKHGSIVETPNVPITAHGKRGITHGSGHINTAWFKVKDLIPAGQNDEQGLGSPVLMPYHTGDVIWSADETDSGIFPAISLQDDQKLTKIAQSNSDSEVGSAEMDVALPRLMPENAAAVQIPDRISTWAYAYVTALRSNVTIRSFVASSDVQRAYWQFNDRYNDQIGNGMAGDRVDDPKLQYGGIVYRDATGKKYYAAYGSMAIMIPPGLTPGQRVFPPFQGNGGGPSGGPLFNFRGAPVDMFFTSAGAGPGSVLKVGETFSFSGVLWPTLASKVDLTVTPPAGSARVQTGRANKVGAYYVPGNDFAVTDPGLHTVQLTVTHDGRTSAGQTTAPYPTGSVLGAANNTFTFYVVPADAPVPTLAASATTLTGAGVTLTVTPPAGITASTCHVTAAFAGEVLRQAAGNLAGNACSFNYRPADYTADFLNLDPDGSDVVNVTLYLAGTSGGQTVHMARRVAFFGGRLVTAD